MREPPELTNKAISSWRYRATSTTEYSHSRGLYIISDQEVDDAVQLMRSGLDTIVDLRARLETLEILIREANLQKVKS